MFDKQCLIEWPGPKMSEWISPVQEGIWLHCLDSLALLYGPVRLAQTSIPCSLTALCVFIAVYYHDNCFVAQINSRGIPNCLFILSA